MEGWDEQKWNFIEWNEPQCISEEKEAYLWNAPPQLLIQRRANKFFIAKYISKDK